MAVVPIPLVPPWMSTLSPSVSLPRSKRLVQTVKNVSGIAAASRGLNPWGSGSACGAGATQYSA